MKSTVSQTYRTAGAQTPAYFLAGISRNFNRITRVVLALAAAGLASTAFSSTVTTIGPEADVALPSSALYHVEIGNQPDDNSVQNLNPPVFSWLYYENPLLYVYNPQQPYTAIRLYQLQLSANPNFSPLIWNIACSNNFYNFLPPITNSDGSTYTGTNYWRVVYQDASGNTLSNSATHTFTMTSNAKIWNRSMLADDNYLLGISTNHPHLFFTANNRDAVSHFLQTNVWPTPGIYWTSTTNDALSYIKSSWWNNPSVFTNVNDWEQFASIMAEVGFTYQLTTNSAIAAANPGEMLEIYATNLMAYGYDRYEAYNLNAAVPQNLGLAYDWLYNIMTPSQRANVLKTMESMAQYYVYEDWLYTGTAPNVNRIYTNTLAVKFGSHFREGESHSRNDQVGLVMSMAAMGESPILRSLNSYFLNYYFAQFDPFQGDDGRAYNSVQNFQVARQFGPLLIAACSFPDWGLTNAPIYTNLANLFAFLEPVGYGGTSEIEPYCWGVQGGAPPAAYRSQWGFTRFYDAACFLQNGAILRQYNRSSVFTSKTGEDPLMEAFVPYYFPPPLESDWPYTTWLDPVRGWAISTSHPPDSWESFTNGCGFIFQARPSAAGRNNATFTDGQVEMWAYGAHVTTGGSGNYEEHCMFQNNSLFVDGIGMNNANPAVSDPWCARITAFTNAADYTFASADLTKAFARTNWSSSGYQDIQWKFYANATNARPYISSVNRSVLFPHKKYLVLYDQFQTTQPAHFQWKWNVWGTTAVVNPTNCSSTYVFTNGYNQSNVTVYVAHIVNPALMSLTNMTTGANLYGTNALNTAKINPFTGENYNLPSWDIYYPDQYWPYWASSIWVQNQAPTNNWHFMTVIFPVKWGQPAPTITRVDDNTVHVQQNGDDDVISFDPSTEPPGVSLNLTGPTLAPSKLSPPANLRTTTP